VGERPRGDTTIELPPDSPLSYRHVLTGHCVCACDVDGRPAVRAAGVFADFPVAMLQSR